MELEKPQKVTSQKEMGKRIADINNWERWHTEEKKGRIEVA